MRLGLRLGLTAALATGLLASAVPVATATTVNASYDSRFGEYYLWILGDRGDNEIGLEFERRAEAFVISDSGPVDLVGSAAFRCGPITRLEVRCNLPAYTWVDVEARKGDDDVSVVNTRRGVEFDGGPGADTFLGSDEGDYAKGGPGGDVLRTFGGNDGLNGSGGHDKFAAGAGKDKIDASDGRRDKRISCGGGKRDKVELDREDPGARGCERRRRA